MADDESEAGSSPGGLRLLAAAARAERRFGDARELLEVALEAEPEPGADRWAISVDLGEVLVECGAIAAAGNLFVAVARDAERHNQPELLARAALGFAAGLGGFEVRLDDQRQASLLEWADRALAGDRSALAAYVKARLSVALSFAEEPDRREAMADEAVRIAEHVDDPGALAHALAARADAIAGPDHTEERLAMADRIIDLGRQAGLPELSLLGRRFQVVALLELGAVAEVDRSVAAFRRETSLHGSAAVRWYVPLWHGMRAALRGDISLALEQAAEAEAIGREANSENAAMLVLTLRFGIGTLTGERDPALEMMARANCGAEVARSGRASARVVLLSLAVSDGDLEQADRHLRLLAASGFGVRDSEWLGSLAICADAAIVLGHRDLQRQVRDLLDRYDGRLIVDGIAAHVIGSVREYLGALDLALVGDPARLEQTILDYERMGAPLLARRARSRLLVDVVDVISNEVDQEASAILEGEVWRISFGGSSCLVRDSKGLQDLVKLLARPDVEVHVSDLAAPVAVAPSTPIVALDDAAKRAYHRRVSDLQEDMDDADSAHDHERAARARIEMDFLLDELRRATGLGGRDRRFGSDHERARQAVRARIRHAIGRIAEHHPALGRHLDRSIRTGTFCRYAPDATTAWRISH